MPEMKNAVFKRHFPSNLYDKGCFTALQLSQLLQKVN
jgi:hypothetical protein